MKILISDFDYTFFDNNYENNILATQKFVNDGNIFIIATGRNLNQIKEEITDKDVPYFFLICNDGAVIYNRKDEILYEKNIDNEIGQKAFKKLLDSKYISEAFIDDMEGYQIYDYSKINKIVGKPKNEKKAKQLLDEILENNEFTGYMSENWLNIINSEVSKGNAIKYILEKYKLDDEEIYVVGDNINDISMLDMYTPYIMEESSPEILKKYPNKVKNIEELINILTSK